tara:strand:+ start:2878 stop:3663 length:786 start_codon:yes stop_codon:yes gene_type:complete
MNEDEILDSIPIVTDSRGKYTNASADTTANNGSRGKLNSDQLDERAILHAKRVGAGYPSYKEIVEHWYKAYNITMALSSEYEWAENNNDRIDREIARLEENGDMPIVAVSNSQITGMLAKSARTITDTLRTNKLAQSDLVQCARLMADPYKAIGATGAEAYYTCSDEQREIFDKRLDHLIKLNDSRTASLNAISKSTSDQGKVLTDLMKVVVELNKSGQNVDKMIAKKAKEQLKEAGLKLQETEALKEVDPLAPVSDEERL